jgi:hypothetical protein
MCAHSKKYQHVDLGDFKLFFLGHMTWAYVWGQMSAGRRSEKLFIPAVLVLGILPDIDLLLRRFGVAHHTFTHSFFFWLVVFVPFFVVFRQRSFPYFVAVVQHFAFGDFIVGSVTILWPFSTMFFGLNIALVSVLDVALEVAGLLLAAGIVCFNGDLRRLLSVDTRNVSMFLPFLALLASILVVAVDYTMAPLVAYISFRDQSLATMLLAHMILAVFLAVSTVQGLRRIVR